MLCGERPERLVNGEVQALKQVGKTERTRKLTLAALQAQVTIRAATANHKRRYLTNLRAPNLDMVNTIVPPLRSNPNNIAIINDRDRHQRFRNMALPS